jgi:hypothetical protein
MSDRLAEIRARLEEATPGPWDTSGIKPYNIENGVMTVKHDSPAEHWPIRHVYHDEQGRRCTEYVATTNDTIGWSLERQGANARLIAHAPSDIAYLLAEVERLQIELDKVPIGLEEKHGILL